MYCDAGDGCSLDCAEWGYEHPSSCYCLLVREDPQSPAECTCWCDKDGGSKRPKPEKYRKAEML